ncbi:hypothetical protein ACFOG5_05490 [Pedobacter fastidiosus]
MYPSVETDGNEKHFAQYFYWQLKDSALEFLLCLVFIAVDFNQRF